MANGLITETSPYLLQHAHNPGDWYPWGGEKAFRHAREQDETILLSIGYSACHWCYVRGMVNGRPTAYICQNHICLQPATEPEERLH